MRKLLFFILLFVFGFAKAQTETHNFITYDTAITYNYDPYHSFAYYLRISRPANLFTAGSPDTASRPAFIMMPGQGQMNASPSSLSAYGPHYFTDSAGWDGSVVLGNGTHYPILITMTCNITPPEPPISGNLWILNYLVNHYHIKPRGVHLTGFSEGSFTWGGMMGITDTTGTSMTGTDIGCRLVTSICLLSGAATSTNWNVFGHWAKQYNGKAFLTVGYGDAQVTNPPLLAQAMNDSVAGSAYFSYNTIGGGSHCCWNTDYDPTLTSWSALPPYGLYVTTNTQPNTQGTYSSPSSIFQWMLRQGDTTLVGNVTPSVADIIPMEYWCGWQGNNDTLYAIFGSTAIPLPLPSGGLIKKVGGCFNLFRAVATDGTLWQSQQYNAGSMSWTQIPTDSSNAAINNAIWINGYADNYVIIRADSSLSYGGVDDPGIFHSSGTVFMRPFKMTTTSAKFRKALICARGVYAVSSDSTQLYFWGPGAGTTPTTIYTFGGDGTGKIIDFACSNGNAFTSATFAIIQQTAGSPYGHPYALGQGYGFWGSTTPQNFTTFTDLYSQWGLTSLVEEINVNFETTTLRDSVQNMWATGWNVQGEVGIDTEFVNRYTYVNWPNYGWDGVAGENPVAGLRQIGIGTKWSHIYSNLFFTYYHFASDINGGLYAWGRNKTNVQGRPYVLNPNDNAAQPNAQDILQPTITFPLAQTVQTVNWVSPILSAGSTQNITTNSTTVSSTGHPALLLLASNTSDTINYMNVSSQWTELSGPNQVTFGTPNAVSTTVSGMTSGTYVFQIFMIDNNQGMNATTVTVNVTLAPQVEYLIKKRGRFYYLKNQ